MKWVSIHVASLSCTCKVLMIIFMYSLLFATPPNLNDCRVNMKWSFYWIQSVSLYCIERCLVAFVSKINGNTFLNISVSREEGFSQCNQWSFLYKTDNCHPGASFIKRNLLIQHIFYHRSYYINIILTHWGRVTHICVGNLTIIESDNGLSPDRRQAIIWTNAGILLIGPLGTNFSEILIGIHKFSFTKMKCRLRNGSHSISASMC